MTPSERLQPFLVSSYRFSVGLPTLEDHPASDAYIQAFRDDPELLVYARGEITRLRASGRRTPAEHDHESKMRCQALERMVKLFEATNG